MQNMVGGTSLAHAAAGKILASSFVVSVAGVEMETETGKGAQHAKAAPSASHLAPGTDDNRSDVTGASFESGSTSTLDMQKQRFTAQIRGDKVTLLRPNLASYHLSDDTPVMLLEYSKYSWSERAEDYLRNTAPPPAGLFIRIHPVKVSRQKHEASIFTCSAKQAQHGISEHDTPFNGKKKKKKSSSSFK